LDTLFERFGKGNCPVIDFLDGLSVNEQAVIWVSIGLIEELGIDTPRRYLEHLGSGLFLIRAREDNVSPRIMAFMFGGYLIATHGFVKKRGSVPETDKKRTRKRKADWEKLNKKTGQKNGEEFLKDLLGG